MTMLIGILLLALCGTAIAAAAWGYAYPRTRALARVRDIEVYGFRGDATAAAHAQSQRRNSLFMTIGAQVGEFLDRGKIRGYEDWMRGRLISAGMYEVAARTLVGLQFLGAATFGLLVAFAAPGSSLAMNVFLTLASAAVILGDPARLRARPRSAPARLDRAPGP